LIGPSTQTILDLLSDIRASLDDIAKDYPQAHDEAYGLSRKGGESGRTGHSDPTSETALTRDGMKATCVRVARRLGQIRQQVDGIAADLDSSLRQSDDPKARAVRIEMADQARIATKEERRQMQADRDHAMNAELQGRSDDRKRGRILAGWRNLSDKVQAS